MAKLSPSILSADFSELAEEVKKVEEGGAHYVHIDVMDGHFVPNISFGAPVMKKLIGKTKLPMDVHLMIENPEKYIPDFVTSQTDYITVHIEACHHIDRVINQIKDEGVKAGVSLNPGTPVGRLEEVLDKVDLVLVMSVNPGFGGQSLIPSTLEKIRKLKEIREQKGYDFEIEIDGGVGLDNLDEVLDAGTDIIVAGSSVFDADDVVERTKAFCERL